jgi:hypothetical protein
MRCKRCGFISFDFNQVCPKCNKEVAGEQHRMNLPSFRPEPPKLLMRLLGETYNADVDDRRDQYDSGEDRYQGINISPDDSLTGIEDANILEDEPGILPVEYGKEGVQIELMGDLFSEGLPELELRPEDDPVEDLISDID